MDRKVCLLCETNKNMTSKLKPTVTILWKIYIFIHKDVLVLSFVTNHVILETLFL